MIGNWLATTSANRFRQTYYGGFVDVSGGDVIQRTGNIIIALGGGDASFNQQLVVGGNTLLNGNVYTIGNNYFYGNTFPTELTVVGNATVAKNAVINGLLTVNNNIYATGTITAKDEMYANKNIFITGNAFINTNLVVNANTVLQGNLYVIRDASFQSTIYAIGNLRCLGNTFAYGDVSANGNIFIAKTVYNSGTIMATNIVVAGNLSTLSTAPTSVFNNQVEFRGNNSVLGYTPMVWNNDVTTVGGNVYVTAGNLYIRGEQVVTNNVYFRDMIINAHLTVSLDVSFGSDLYVSGKSVFGNTYNKPIAVVTAMCPSGINVPAYKNGIVAYNPVNSANQDACISATVSGLSAGNPYLTFNAFNMAELYKATETTVMCSRPPTTAPVGTTTLWYSKTSGKTWLPGANSGNLFAEAFCATNYNNTWIAGGRGGTSRLAYSLDDGNTWTSSATGNAAFDTSVLSVSHGQNLLSGPNTSVFVAGGIDQASGTSLAYSINGQTWTQSVSKHMACTNSIQWNGAYFLAAGNAYVFGANNANTVVKSADGITWTPVTAGQPFNITCRKLVWNNSQWIAIGLDSNVGVTMSTSQDGINWSPMPISINAGYAYPETGFGLDYTALTQSPELTGTTLAVYREINNSPVITDIGASWESTRNLTGEIMSTACSADGRYVVCCTRESSSTGFVYTSANYGLSFTKAEGLGRFPNIPYYCVTISSTTNASSSYTIYAGGNSSELYVSYDFGVTVSTIIPVTSNWRSVACNTTGTLALASSFVGLVYIINVSTVTAIDPITPSVPRARNWQAVCMSDDGSYMFAMADASSVYRSTNYGVSWSNVLVAPFSSYFSSIACSYNGKFVIAATTSTSWIKSENFGNSFSLDTALPSGAWCSVAIASSASNANIQIIGVIGSEGGLTAGSIYTVFNYPTNKTNKSYLPNTAWRCTAISRDGKRAYTGSYANATGTSTFFCGLGKYDSIQYRNKLLFTNRQSTEAANWGSSQIGASTDTFNITSILFNFNSTNQSGTIGYVYGTSGPYSGIGSAISYTSTTSYGYTVPASIQLGTSTGTGSNIGHINSYGWDSNGWSFSQQGWSIGMDSANNDNAFKIRPNSNFSGAAYVTIRQDTGAMSVGSSLATLGYKFDVTGNAIVEAMTISSTKAATASTVGNAALVINGGVGIANNLIVSSVTAASSASTGAVVVAGGIASNHIYLASTSSGNSAYTNGALVTQGGIAARGVSYLQNINVTDTTDATSATSAPITIAGGLGVAKRIFSGTDINAPVGIFTSNTSSTTTSTGALRVTGGIGAAGTSCLQELIIASGVASSSTSTGALRVTGGIGAGAACYFQSINTTGLSTLHSLGVTNATTLNTLSVTGTSTLNSLGVTNASTLNSLSVTNATTLNSLSVTNGSTLNTVTVSGTLGVTGLSTLSSLSVTNGSTLNTVTVSGSLGVTGSSTLNTLSVSGTTNLNGTANLNGTTNANIINVSGASNLNTMSVTGTTSFNTLNVTNAVSFSGTLGVSGLATLTTLTVTGTSNLNGAINMNGAVTANTITANILNLTTLNVPDASIPVTKINGLVGLNTAGYVGINKAALSSGVFYLDVSGSVQAYTFNALSDRRLKTNIIPMNSQREHIMRISPVSFDWKTDGRADVGFIAQDIHREFPMMRVQESSCNVVDDDEPVDPVTGEPCYLSMDYGKLTPILWQHQKELVAEIESLKENNFHLQSQVDDLRTLLNSIIKEQQQL